MDDFVFEFLESPESMAAMDAVLKATPGPSLDNATRAWLDAAIEALGVACKN